MDAGFVLALSTVIILWIVVGAFVIDGKYRPLNDNLFLNIIIELIMILLWPLFIFWNK